MHRKFLLLTAVFVFFCSAIHAGNNTEVPNIDGVWSKWKLFGNKGWVETFELRIRNNRIERRLLKHKFLPLDVNFRDWYTGTVNFDGRVFTQDTFGPPEARVCNWQLMVVNPRLMIEEYNAGGQHYSFEIKKE